MTCASHAAKYTGTCSWIHVAVFPTMATTDIIRVSMLATVGSVWCYSRITAYIQCVPGSQQFVLGLSSGNFSLIDHFLAVQDIKDELQLSRVKTSA